MKPNAHIEAHDGTRNIPLTLNEFQIEFARQREAAEAMPWDWADYEALWMLAKHYEEFECAKQPVALVLERCHWQLEDEQWRAQVAERIRRIAG